MSTTSTSQVPGVYHRRLGDMLVTSLGDGYVDMGYEFFRDVSEAEAKAMLDREHRVSPPRISVNAFALRVGGKTYLVDCGSADTMGPTCGRLPENLKVAGIDPGSVDAVLLTHVHPDHSSGLTDAATGERLFPNAEVIVHETEVNHWFDDAAMAKATERQKRRYFLGGRTQLSPYRAAGRVRTFTQGEVLPGVTAIASPGHTPGHSVYLVTSGGESMIIWGDTVHVPEIQISKPEISTQADTDPAMAAVSRREVFDMATRDGLLVGGMHVHFPGLGYMRSDAGRYSLVVDQWAFIL